jgi:carboxylesterase type B
VIFKTGFNGTTTFHAQSPVDLAFASEMYAYWLSFVRSANPNTHKLARSPVWDPYSASHRVRIVLQDDPHNTTTRSGSFMEAEPADETARCAFIASQVEREQN